MSVLSRTRTDRHSQEQSTSLPQQRTPGSTVPTTVPVPTRGGRRRTAGLATGLIIVLGAAGTGVWAMADDGGTPTAPAVSTVDTLGTEDQRDAATARRGESDRLADQLSREAQRDAARSGIVAR